MITSMPAEPLVLIVEDEMLIAVSLEIGLTAKGYRVLGPAATVNESIELLQVTRPDLALVDYRLAHTTTEALLPELDSRRIPLCVLSGYSPSQLPVAYSGYLVLEKPFRMDALLDVLQRMKGGFDGVH